MNKPSFKKPHLNSLTGLRFFAAIYIVLFHHGNALCIFGASVCNLISYGYISVSLFAYSSSFLDLFFPTFILTPKIYTLSIKENFG